MPFTTIKRVRAYKWLGLVLDENLTLHKHVDHVKSRWFHLLHVCGGISSTSQRKIAYVHSHLSYMANVPVISWSSCRPFKIVVKAMYRLLQLISTTYLYSTSFLPIKEMEIVERVTSIHKMINSLTKRNFVMNLGIHGRSTRTKCNPYVKRNSTNLSDPALLFAMSTIVLTAMCDRLGVSTPSRWKSNFKSCGRVKILIWFLHTTILID